MQPLETEQLCMKEYSNIPLLSNHNERWRFTWLNWNSMPKSREAFFSGMHKEISIIKHHTSLGQHVFLYWQAKWGISNLTLLAFNHLLHNYCFNVLLAIRHLSIFGQWGIHFKECWFCIKGYRYVSGITFIQQYLKNNDGLILAGHTHILYYKQSDYKFSAISTLKLTPRGKTFRSTFSDSTLCFTLPYLSLLLKHINIAR